MRERRSGFDIANCGKRGVRAHNAPCRLRRVAAQTMCLRRKPSKKSKGAESLPRVPPDEIAMNDLSFSEAQVKVDAWISKFEEGYFPPLVQIARLVEELGELSRSVSHATGVKKPKPGETLHNVEEEIGDMLFVLTCLANSLHISLADVFEQTLHKIDARDTSRWTLKNQEDIK